METTSASVPKSTFRQVWKALKWGGVVLLVVFLMTMVMGPGPIQPILYLAIGWISFLVRTLPAITWNWDLVATAAVCCAVSLLIAHWFLCRLTAGIASGRGATLRWRWRWTWGGLGLVGAAFVVGMCVAGIVHQAGWIAGSPESWYEIKGTDIRLYADQRDLELAVQLAAGETSGDPAAMRAMLNDPGHALWRGSPRMSMTDGRPLLHRFHVLVVPPAGDGSKPGYLIYPRGTTKGTWFRGACSLDGRQDDFRPEELPDLIEKHGTNMVAL